MALLFYLGLPEASMIKIIPVNLILILTLQQILEPINSIKNQRSFG
jgi:hypothetical protein